VPNFVPFVASNAELAHGQKSRTHTLIPPVTHSLNHIAY